LTAIWIFDDITAETAQYVCYEIFKAQDDDHPIDVFINSCGGDVSSGLAIINAIRYSTVPIQTIVCGTAYSIAMHIAAAGTTGYRRCLKNSSYMYSEMQLSMGAEKSHQSMTSYLKEFDKVISMERRMLSEITNLSLKDIEKYAQCGHEKFFTTDEALKYGLVDEVIDYATHIKKVC